MFTRRRGLKTAPYVESASDDVVRDLHVRAGTLTVNPVAQLRDRRIASCPIEQPRIVDQHQMTPHRVREQRAEFMTNRTVVAATGCSAAHEVAVKPEKRRITELFQDSRQDDGAVAEQKFNTRIAGKAAARAFVNLRRHLNRNETLKMRPHRLDHLAGERTGLDERRKLSRLLILKNCKLLHYMRRRQRTSA